MDWANIITVVLEALIPTAITILGIIIINFLKKKGAKDETLAYVREAYTLVTKAVLFVNQTYTDTIKENGLKLTDEQKEVAKALCVARFNILASDAIKLAIEAVYTSTDKWLETVLEADVWDAKGGATIGLPVDVVS